MVETAWVEIDQKERLAELEEAVDVQRETLEIALKDLAAEVKKTSLKERDLQQSRKKQKKTNRKMKNLKKLRDFCCKFSKKKLKQTIDTRGR